MSLPVHSQRQPHTHRAIHLSLHPTPVLRREQVDTVRLEISVDDVLGMEVAVGVEAGANWLGATSSPSPGAPAPSLVPGLGGSLHALGRLPGHIYELDHVETCVGNMEVVVEAGALTPLCDDGKARPGHEAHEQQDVDMTCLPVGREGGIRAGVWVWWKQQLSLTF